jgi:hypothetical protein
MKKNNNMLTSTFNKLASNKILTNKITLYIVMAIAFLSLYRYIIISEFSAVLLFFIIVALAYNFTKNMTIVLGSAFLVTFLVSMLKGFLGFKEGMTEGQDGEGDLSKKLTDLVANMKDDNSNTTTTTRPTTQTTQTTQATQATPTTPTRPTNSQDTDDSNKTSQKANYQNQIPLTPGLYNMPNKEQLTKQLGKASETEQAYDNLEKIMGSKNIQTMSNDTQDLIRQQNELIKQLKSMTPALNDAMTALGGLDLSKLTNMFNNIPQKGE